MSATVQIQQREMKTRELIQQQTNKLDATNHNKCCPHRLTCDQTKRGDTQMQPGQYDRQDAIAMKLTSDVNKKNFTPHLVRNQYFKRSFGHNSLDKSTTFSSRSDSVLSNSKRTNEIRAATERNPQSKSRQLHP